MMKIQLLPNFPMVSAFLIFLATAASLLHRTDAGLIVHVSEGQNLTFYAPAIQLLGGSASFEPLTAPLVIRDLSIDPHNVTGINGKLVLVTEGRDFFPWASQAQVNGAAGLILRNGHEDQLGVYEFRIPSSGPITIPVVVVSLQTYRALQPLLDAQPHNITATIDSSGGPSMMRQLIMSPVFWTLSILLAAAHCWVAALLFIKWFKFYQVIDPMNQRLLFPHTVHLVFRTISIPFSLSATLLLTMYWFETVQGTSMSFSWSVDRLRYPAYGLTAAYFILEIVIDILFLTGIYNVVRWLADYAVSAFYLVTGTALGVFFFYTGIRVLARLFQAVRRERATVSSAGSATHGKQLKADKRAFVVAQRIVATAVALLGSFVAGIISITPQYVRQQPSFYVYTWFCVHLFLTLKALATGAALRVPKRFVESKRATAATASASLNVVESEK